MIFIDDKDLMPSLSDPKYIQDICWRYMKKSKPKVWVMDHRGRIRRKL